MTNEELEQKVKRLEEELTEVRIELLERKASFIPYKPYEVEVPKDIDYYYVDELGGIHSVGELSNYYDFEKIYRRGLAFKTKEEAEKYDKERILLFKLHKWAEEHNGGWTPNWKESDNKFFICYFHNSGSFHVKDTWHANDFHKLPYFKSEKIAEQFIEEFGDEIKEVFC